MKLQMIIDQAQNLIDNEQYERAYEILKTTYEQDPSIPELVEKLALTAKTLDLPDDATFYWEKLSEIDPNSLVAYSELQDIYLHSNKYKYYLTRAKVKIMQNHIDQAISDYKKAINTTSEEDEIIEARLLMAKSYEFIHKHAKAMDEYYKILDHRHDLAVFYKLAELCSTTDKYAAINVLERGMESFPNEENFKELLARLLVETNQLDSALKYAKQDFTKIKIYLMIGENEKAFQILEMMEDKTTAQYLILLAEYYFNENDFDACVDTIGEFKKLEPQNPIIYQMLALVEEEKNNMHCAHKYWGKFYSLKQDTELSLSEYMLAHNLNPKDAEIINEIIRINENLGNNSSLMEFYEKLIVINPNDTLALEKLGDFYFNMYEFRNAAEYYEKFVEKNKNKYEILLKLGKCHEKLKNEALAKEYYQNYLSKAPLTPENEALKQKLSSLSDENMAEDEGFLEKILGFFAKK